MYEPNIQMPKEHIEVYVQALNSLIDEYSKRGDTDGGINVIISTIEKFGGTIEDGLLMLPEKELRKLKNYLEKHQERFSWNQDNKKKLLEEIDRILETKKKEEESLLSKL